MAFKNCNKFQYLQAFPCQNLIVSLQCLRNQKQKVHNDMENTNSMKHTPKQNKKIYNTEKVHNKQN